MALVMFADESKARGYTFVAVIATPAQAGLIRGVLTGLRMRGQRRIHFVRERDSRRRAVLSGLDSVGTRAYLYHVDGLGEKDARPLCLDAIVQDAARDGVERLVFESDESVAPSDLRVLHDAVHRAGGRAPRLASEA